MALKTVHSEILDAIKSKIDEIVAIKSITIGELKVLPPDKFPAVYVIPSKDEEGDENVAEILHKFRTKVVVMVRSGAQEPLAGMTSLIDLTGDVHDKLLEDRTLGGKCEILYFIDRDFDYQIGQDFHLFWSIITIEPWKAI